jgi:hypothetical protein
MVAKFYYQDYVFYAHVLSTLILALNALHHCEGFWSIVNQKISYGCEQESQDLI